jgi:hypothetical protein
MRGKMVSSKHTILRITCCRRLAGVTGTTGLLEKGVGAAGVLPPAASTVYDYSQLAKAEMQNMMRRAGINDSFHKAVGERPHLFFRIVKFVDRPRDIPPAVDAWRIAKHAF